MVRIHHDPPLYRSSLSRVLPGSCPTRFGSLAQLVEQLAFNQLVDGSNPSRPTKYGGYAPPEKGEPTGSPFLFVCPGRDPLAGSLSGSASFLSDPAGMDPGNPLGRAGSVKLLATALSWNRDETMSVPGWYTGVLPPYPVVHRPAEAGNDDTGVHRVQVGIRPARFWMREANSW